MVRNVRHAIHRLGQLRTLQPPVPVRAGLVALPAARRYRRAGVGRVDDHPARQHVRGQIVVERYGDPVVAEQQIRGGRPGRHCRRLLQIVQEQTVAAAQVAGGARRLEQQVAGACLAVVRVGRRQALVEVAVRIEQTARPGRGGVGGGVGGGRVRHRRAGRAQQIEVDRGHGRVVMVVVVIR